MKTLTDYLFVEFHRLKKGQEEPYLTRIRYRVIQFSGFCYGIRIEDSGSPYMDGKEGKKVRHSQIHVDARMSEDELFNEVREFISKKYGAEKEAVAFRWENDNLTFREKRL